MGCAVAPAEDPVAQTEQRLDSRFDPTWPASVQTDGWSCSVHTTTWMLGATGHDVTWSLVGDRMLGTGRVTTDLGLMDAAGTGLAQTLRDFAGTAPAIGSQREASFDEIAARAGKMAVGIGGRHWNHWTAVRGYDASRDVLLLANSKPDWQGVGQELDRGEFARLGTFALAWMDFGQFTSEPPPAGPFEHLVVKQPIGTGQWLTQCVGTGERVWQSVFAGPDPSSRWAKALYPQEQRQACGEPHEGRYPIVLRSVGLGPTPWITECAGPRSQRVYHVESSVDGHPAAAYRWDEPSDRCP